MNDIESFKQKWQAHFNNDIHPLAPFIEYLNNVGLIRLEVNEQTWNAVTDIYKDYNERVMKKGTE